MKWLCKSICAVLVCVTSICAAYAAADSATCNGKFPNPITDICWSCAFPLKIGSASLFELSQEDNNSSSGSPFCACSNPPRIGVKTSFFEPVRMVDITATPWCFVGLGGVKMDPGIDAPEGTVGFTAKNLNNNKHAFYQAHWYINPVMYLLEILLDDRCGENAQFDVGMPTEVDPTWDDPELALILSPESALVANPVAQVACTADCVTATAGFPINSLFWCSGCNGPLFPLTGHVASYVSPAQASSLIMHRMIYKMHRELLIWAGAGEDGLCSYYPQPVMDKNNYKYQMLYPVPQTEKINGRCCQPIGRSTQLWAAGKDIPWKGFNYMYQIFRKRDCCAGAAGF